MFSLRSFLFNLVQKSKKKKRVYKGGSGGIFEEDLARVFSEGSVVALLNPRVMKPFTVGVLPLSKVDMLICL